MQHHYKISGDSNGFRWTAISRGAVIKAMSDGQAGVKVTTRISRRNYGVKRRELFNPSLHLQIDRTYCPLRMEYQAKNQMIWYLRKVSSCWTIDNLTNTFREPTLLRNAQSRLTSVRCILRPKKFPITNLAKSYGALTQMRPPIERLKMLRSFVI